MLERQDLGRLADFQQLTHLTVGENVLKDIYDFAPVSQDIYLN